MKNYNRGMFRTRTLLLFGLALLLSSCNFPTVIDGDALPVETGIALTVAAELGAPADAQPAATVQAAEPAPPAPNQAPTALVAEYPTVSLDGGSGYLFATGATSTDDRDVWWNASGFVPNTLMASLGTLDSLTAVNTIPLSMMTFDEFQPQLGEGFAVAVDRDLDGSAEGYALIRVLDIDVDQTITFEVLYPYAGALLP